MASQLAGEATGVAGGSCAGVEGDEVSASFPLPSSPSPSLLSVGALVEASVGVTGSSAGSASSGKEAIAVNTLLDLALQQNHTERQHAYGSSKEPPPLPPPATPSAEPSQRATPRGRPPADRAGEQMEDKTAAQPRGSTPRIGTVATASPESTGPDRAALVEEEAGVGGPASPQKESASVSSNGSGEERGGGGETAKSSRGVGAKANELV